MRGFFVTLIKNKQMHKAIKTVLLLTGVLLLLFGIYSLTIPETQVSIGNLKLIKVHDNSSSYLTIGIGFLAVVLSLIKGKK